MRGSRAQIDMDRYRIYMRNLLLNTPNLQITQEIATQILTQDSKITGVKTHLDNEYSCDKLIITTGTFLNGLSVIQNITIKPYNWCWKCSG